MDDTKTLADVEKNAIIEACKKHRTASDTAAALGVSRATLYRRLKKHGINRGVLND